MKKIIARIYIISSLLLIFGFLIYNLVIAIKEAVNIGHYVTLNAEKVKFKFDLDGHENEENHYTDKGIKVIYFNVYNAFDTFVFKDEGYIILEKGGYMGLSINYDEKVKVYDIDEVDNSYVEVEELPIYFEAHGRAVYSVGFTGLIKIKFDSSQSDKYNLSDIILYT